MADSKSTTPMPRADILERIQERSEHEAKLVVSRVSQDHFIDDGTTLWRIVSAGYSRDLYGWLDGHGIDMWDGTSNQAEVESIIGWWGRYQAAVRYDSETARWVKRAGLEEIEEPATPSSLKPASDSVIHQKIDEVYNEAEAARSKPPNLKEIGKVVQPKLHAAGYDASENHIANLAKDPRYGGRRGKPGVKASLKKPLQH
jgi:hypothetical protein